MAPYLRARTGGTARRDGPGGRVDFKGLPGLSGGAGTSVSDPLLQGQTALVVSRRARLATAHTFMVSRYFEEARLGLHNPMGYAVGEARR
jgi:hypothetical protein